MVIFKCPYCRTDYEMMTARLSFQQLSYAKCQVCNETMYSWNSRNVPIFTLHRRAFGIPTVTGVRDDAGGRRDGKVARDSRRPH
jgi:hypothetical protein